MLGLTPWKVQPLCPCFTLPLDYAQSGWTRQSLFLWESGSGNRRFLHYFPQGSWANPEKNLPLSRKQTQLKILLLVPTPPSSACLWLRHLSQMGKSCRDFSTSRILSSTSSQPAENSRRWQEKGRWQGLTPSPGKSEGYNIPGAVGHCQSLWLIPEG